MGSTARVGLYFDIADMTVKSHSSHLSRGCIPRVLAVGWHLAAPLPLESVGTMHTIRKTRTISISRRPIRCDATSTVRFEVARWRLYLMITRKKSRTTFSLGQAAVERERNNLKDFDDFHPECEQTGPNSRPGPRFVFLVARQTRAQGHAPP